MVRPSTVRSFSPRHSTYSASISSRFSSRAHCGLTCAVYARRPAASVTEVSAIFMQDVSLLRLLSRCGQRLAGVLQTLHSLGSSGFRLWTRTTPRSEQSRNRKGAVPYAGGAAVSLFSDVYQNVNTGHWPPSRIRSCLSLTATAIPFTSRVHCGRISDIANPSALHSSPRPSDARINSTPPPVANAATTATAITRPHAFARYE